MPGALAWGYYPTDKIWLPIRVDSAGRVKADMSAINLDDLADVSVAAPTDGYIVYWDAATSLWKCKAIPAADWAAITGKPTSPSLEELATEHEADGTHGAITPTSCGLMTAHVAADDPHIVYMLETADAAAALAAAVQAGAITDGVTKAPTHDAVFDVKETAEAAQTAAEVATAVSDHAALTTGIHGAGANVLLNSSLMTNLFTPIADEILRQENTAACPSPFSALINGTPTTTSVVYDGETNEASVAGIFTGVTYWGRIMLYNSTRGTYRKIVSVNTSTNTITTEASTDAWANNDAITTQSQTNTTAGYFDMDLSTNIPASATVVNLTAQYYDSSAVAYDNQRCLIIHPFSAYNKGKRFHVNACPIGDVNYNQFFVPVISQKITMFYRGTANLIGAFLTVKGYY